VRRIRVTGPAKRDIDNVLQRSGEEFGRQARQRYRKLIDQAIQDLSDDATRAGVRPIGDIREGYFIYHLKWSRKTLTDSPVGQPRHLISFYIDHTNAIIVARVFHERQMLSRYLKNHNNY
jgi:plasmid stabilization system protein ParE